MVSVRRKVAILTLTRFPDIFDRLADSILKHEDYTVRRVVVASGDFHLDPNSPHAQEWEVVQGIEPFVFARNVNRGLAHIGPDTDVLLVNDDCEWTMPLVGPLAYLADQHPDAGIISPLIDGGVGNDEQDRSQCSRISRFFAAKNPICFVCVYLPAAALAAIGPMDEQFTGYGGDDLDYNTRADEKGFRRLISCLSIVRHGFGPSVPYSASFRRVMTGQQQHDSMREMNVLAQEKHAQRVAVIIPSGPVPRNIGFEHSVHALKLPPGSIRLRAPGKSAARNRNEAIKQAPNNITHFFPVDDDHWFEPDTVMKLLRHRQPVVSALVTASAPPAHPLVCKAIEWKDGIPAHRWYTWTELKGQTGLLEVPAAAGSGVLIARDVFARLDPPWFVYGKYDPEEPSEDVYLYERIRNLTEPRVPIYVDLDTMLYHYDTAAACPERDQDGNWRVKFMWQNGTSITIDPTQGET
jgi:hypothetical protein